MTVRRLLLGVGGGGEFGASVPSDIFALTSAPQGGWSTPQFPEATYYNGKSYFTWVNGDTGGLYVASYTHATGVVSTPFLLDTPTPADDHNNPAVLVRESDKRIIVAFCEHVGDNMFIRVSTNPEDVTAFGAAENLDTGSPDHTYPSIVQLLGIANDPIHVLYRDFSGTPFSTTGRLCHVVSTDGGATWSSVSRIMTGATNRRPYWAIATDNSSRIHVVATDRDPYVVSGTLRIAHFYFDANDPTHVYDSFGAQVADALPVGASSANITTVYDGSDGNAFVMDAVLVGSEPRCTFIVDQGSTVSARYGKWTGSAWSVSEIYNADTFPVDRYYGSAAIDRSDPSVVYAGIKTGAATSELYRFTSPNDGDSWGAGVPLTTGSSDLNAAPIAIANGVSTLRALWLRGTISSSTIFDFGIYGLR